MRKRRRKILPRADINVTPFIDILLVLLVIFMTISPNKPKVLQTDVPREPPPGPALPDNDKALVLSLNRNGVIRINQDEVEPGHLIGRLQEILKTRRDRTLFLQADHELLFNDVAQLIDAAKGAGVDRLGLLTETISNSR